MAILRTQDGREIHDPATIAAAFAPLGVKLEHRPTGDDPTLAALLAKPALHAAEKETVLARLDPWFEHLKATAGYQSRDLVVLHPDVPNLAEMLAKFDRCHTHDDDEVRYIVAGEGVFGFDFPDGTQAELVVQAQEYVNVPANTRHWFYLTPARCIKAVRYFTDTAGWTPRYTDTPVRVPRLGA